MSDPKTPALPEPQPLDEVYDTMMVVEMDPCGAWQAIQTLSAQLQEALDRADRAERDRDKSGRAWRDAFETMHQRAMRAETALDSARKVIEEARDVLANYADPTGYTDCFGEPLTSGDDPHPGLLAEEARYICDAWLSANKKEVKG